MKKQTNFSLIIGCGRLGASFANMLSDQNENVLVLDCDANSFRKLSVSFGGLTMTGDARDIDVLEKAEIEKATAVIVVTDNDNTNIMIAQLAKELFKKKRVITRLNNPEKECVYEHSGIETLSPVALSIKEICKFVGGIE
ncbi:trk system potassium uptake protein TrkA [Pilibacter termitis]|uniref:Trk system potassium uptake protein TrkA n=1 Tax=Pilibacter termitis TaxID=263852 RepID=A0A1T4M6S0_9ENTE|nr:TrkA family potassium uptake protein [Pilibacter termitis]SJZ62424.1 trk system potassium uptake protein TrkA [Pilibacter termitis]